MLPGIGSGTGTAGLLGLLNFNGTIDSDPAASAAINLTALGGSVTFGGGIGQSHALGAISLPNGSTVLLVDGNVAAASLANSGSTTVNASGATIATTAGQTYSGAVKLASDATFKDSSTGGVDFVSFIDNVSTARNLTVSATRPSGNTVGGLGALASVDVTDKTLIDALAVSTTAGQTYGGAVTLGTNTALNGTLVSFNSTVDGAQLRYSCRAMAVSVARSAARRR